MITLNNSSCTVSVSSQVHSYNWKNRLRQRAGPDPLPSVEPSTWWMVSVELAVPSAAGASQSEEAGPESTTISPGTTRWLHVCCFIHPGKSFLQILNHQRHIVRVTLFVPVIRLRVLRGFHWQSFGSFTEGIFCMYKYLHVAVSVSAPLLCFLRWTEFFSLSQMFVSGTKVLACWTDCRFYPAKILRVNKDGEAQFHLLYASWVMLLYISAETMSWLIDQSLERKSICFLSSFKALISQNAW